MLLIRLLLPAAVLLFLYGCTKDDLPQAGGERLQKIIFNKPDSFFQASFFYDDQGRLAVIEDSMAQAHIFRILLHYNEQNRMVKRVWMHYQGSTNNYQGQWADSFVYDHNNRIVKWMSVPNNAAQNDFTYTYGYDIQGRLTTDTFHRPGADDRFTKYSYDASDNVVQSEALYYQSGVLQGTSNLSAASYTAQLNPYQGLGPESYFLLFGYINSSLLLSKHLPQREVYADSSTNDYLYEYYSNGLPRKITEVFKRPDWTSWTDQRSYEFFYE